MDIDMDMERCMAVRGGSACGWHALESCGLLTVVALSCYRVPLTIAFEDVSGHPDSPSTF